MNPSTIFMDSEPYPEVAGGNDPATVALLKEDYAGAVSELTAILLYVFQNITAINDKAYSNAVLQISKVEMKHLDLLGDAIQTLGGSPDFHDGRQFWQAGYVNYATSVEEMLRTDIISETQAIGNYRKHAAQTRNASVRNLLLRIIEDETLHLRYFTEKLAQVRAGK